MEDYYDDEEDWDMDDTWWEDPESTADILVGTAYGHEPPWDPDTYDAYDSEDYAYDDENDEYFEGPLPDPDPSMPVPSSLQQPPPTPTPSLSPSSTTSISTSQWRTENQRRYNTAIAGRKFYGEEDPRDKEILRGVRKNGYPPQGKRKRRKISVDGVAVRIAGEDEVLLPLVTPPQLDTKKPLTNPPISEKEEGYHSEEGSGEGDGKESTEQRKLRARIKQVEIRDTAANGVGPPQRSRRQSNEKPGPANAAKLQTTMQSKIPLPRKRKTTPPHD